MVRMAAQDPALTDLALVVAAQIPVFRAKAIKVVLISNLLKGISSNSLVIRVIQSSRIVDNIICLPLACANGTRNFIREL